MTMRKYPKYKDSGIEWIGEIPKHWGLFRVKNLIDPYKYYQVGDGDHGAIKPEMYQEDGIPYIRVQNLSWGFNLNNEGMVYISEEVHKANSKSRLIPNDILIAKTGATIGKTAIIPTNMPEANTTSSVGKLTVNRKNFNTRFIGYCFLSKQFQDQIWQDASQKSAQPGFNIDDLVLYRIVSPSLDEQKAIADYLYEKMALIDELIDKKQRQIELLKEQRQAVINQAVTKGLDPDVPMKDSGIEWLGEIPEHWEVKKIKFLLRRQKSSIKTGPFGSQLKNIDFKDEGIKVYNQRNVLDGNFEQGETYISPEKYEELEAFEISPDDILITTRGTIGKCAVFPPNAEKGVLHPCLIRMQLDQGEVLNEYVVWYIQDSSFFEENVHYNSDATTIDVIYSDTLKEVQIPTPPLDEQRDILAYIKREAKEIEHTVNTAQKQIKLLQEYRTALISEAVTGKIDVREN